MRLIMGTSVFLFMGVLLGVSLKARQLLTTLLCLEGLTLSLLGFLLSWSLATGSFWAVMSFLAFAICEAALGLSLLTVFARANGNDYVLATSQSC